jgi:hypothetical protein
MVVGDGLTRDDRVKLMYELHDRLEALEAKNARLRLQLEARGGSKTMAILRSLFGTWDCRGLAPLDACLGLLAPAAL